MTHVVASPLTSPHESTLLEEDDDAYFLNTDASTANKPSNNKDIAASATTDVSADVAARDGGAKAANAPAKSHSYRKTGSINMYASPSMKIDADAESPFHHQQLELQLEPDSDPAMQECEKVRDEMPSCLLLKVYNVLLFCAVLYCRALPVSDATAGREVSTQD
jgi:hypothetical protein